MVDGQGKHGEVILVGQEETREVKPVGKEEDRHELTTPRLVASLERVVVAPLVAHPSEAKG